MPPPVPELPSKQMKAALALAQGCSIDEAAKRANCSEKSVDRWLRNSDFQYAKLALQRQFHDAEIQAYLAGLKNTSEQHFRIAKTLLNKIEDWVDGIDFDSMSHSSILKVMAETRSLIDCAMNGKDASLGLDRLRQKYLEDLTQNEI